MIAPDVIIPFDGNHADIPSGFTRETSLDGKFPKGWGTQNPDTTGGNSTHTHASPSHSHSLASHSHTGNTGSCTNNTSHSADAWLSGITILAGENHTHSYTTGAKTGGDTDQTAVTWGSESNDPPYYEMIFIKSTGYNSIPDGGVIFSENTSRNSLSFHTPSANKFIKGAESEANAGSTGGSTTNTHDISHTHATNAHDHGNATTGTAPKAAQGRSTPNAGYVQFNHAHTASFTTATQNLNSYSGSVTTSETVQPEYRTLNAYKNETGDNVLPAVGDIALFLGVEADIPVGWKAVENQKNYYLKNNSTASASSTGGSNTHTHASHSHAHTGSGSHSHSASFNDYTGQSEKYHTDKNYRAILGTHSHYGANTSSNIVNYNSTSVTPDSASNEPEYLTVVYIQFEFPPVMPNPILKAMIDQVENWPV